MRRLLLALGVLLAASCGTAHAPEPQPVVRLLERGDVVVQGTALELETAEPRDLILRAERVKHDLGMIRLPDEPLDGTLRVVDSEGIPVVRRKRPAALLEEHGFAYVPPLRVLPALHLEHDPSWVIWTGLESPDQPPGLRLDDPARRPWFRLIAFEPQVTVSAVVRGTGVLHGEVQERSIGSREIATSTWQRVTFEPIRGTPGVQICRLWAEGSLNLAWVEWRGNQAPLLLLRGEQRGDFRVSYETRRKGRDQVLYPQAMAHFRSLAGEFGVDGTRIGELVRRLDIGGDRRAGWWTPTTTLLDLDVEWAVGDQLRFAVGLTDDPPELVPYHLVEPEDPCTASLRVLWQAEGGATFQELKTTPIHTSKGSWIEAQVDVTEAHAGRGTLRFEVHGPSPVSVGIAEPRIRRVAAARRRMPPNLIVYTVDTLRADHLSCYGWANATSPHLDALAEESILFERLLAVSPWTRPATATMLTGFHPTWHGMGKNRELDPELVTLAEVLRSRGYSTWAAVANPNVGAEPLGFEQGFDRFADSRGIGVRMEASDRLRASSSELLHATLSPWLRRHGDEPFFLYLHSMDPHAPYRTPPGAANPFGANYRGPWRNRDLRRTNFLKTDLEITEEDRRYISDVYDNEIHHQDAQLGELVELLRGLELLENTLLVVTSDHGEELRDHGEWDHGYRMWDELLHVPLVVRLPESSRERLGLRPHRIPEMVSQLDLTSTLLDLMDLEDPARRQGQSLLPLMQGESVPARTFYAYDENAWEADEIAALVQGRHKLIWTSREGEARMQLFDLESDPDEGSDLGTSQVELVRELDSARRSLHQRLGRTQTREREVDLDARTRAELESLGYAGDDH